MTVTKDQNQGAPRPFPAPFALYGLALALLGLAVGLFAGLSRSPIVGVLLPLLFGLIGGAGGLYLTRADLDSETGRRRVGLIGLMITILLVFTIGGAIYGMLVRTGSDFAALIPGIAVEDDPRAGIGVDLDELEPAAALELAALRHRLTQLGASPSEVAQILKSARDELGAPLTRTAFAQRFESLRMLANQVATVVSQAYSREREAPNSLTDIERFGRIKFEQYGYLAGELDHKSVPPTGLTRLIDEDRRIYFRLIRVGEYDDDSLASWLMSHPEVRDKLWELELAYAEAYHDALKLGWLSGQPLAESIDKLLAGTGVPAIQGSDVIAEARERTGMAR